MASPHFENLLVSKTSDASASNLNPFLPPDSLPSYDVTEDSETLDCLFRLIYPIPRSPIKDVRLAGKVLEAAFKYEMKQAEDEMRSCWGRLADQNPVAAYAIACKLNLEDEARIAAHCAIGKPGLRYVPELDEVKAGPYFRFLEFIHAKVPAYEEAEWDPMLSPGFSRKFIAAPEQDPSSSRRDPSPFHSNPEFSTLSRFPVDIILQASSGEQVRAHRILLSMASPVLSALIDGVSKPDGDNLPTLPIDLEGHQLTKLVSLCYRMCSSGIHTIEDFVEIIELGNKFEISGIDQMARAQVLTLKGTEKEPLRVYYLCLRFGWHEEARSVAMRLALLSTVEVYCPEMEHVPAWAYFNIRRYHYRCHSAMSTRLHASGRRLRTSMGPSAPGFLQELQDAATKREFGESFSRSAVKDVSVPRLCIDSSRTLTAFT